MMPGGSPTPGAAPAASATQRQQQQQPLLPSLSPKGPSRKDVPVNERPTSAAMAAAAATAAAASVYHTDDNGMTGYAVSGGC